MSQNKQPTNKNNSQQSANKVHQVLQQVTTGPIPSPEILEKYNAIIPGAAERILIMAESEAKHRHQNETKALEANIKIAEVNAETVKNETLLKNGDNPWQLFCIYFQWGLQHTPSITVCLQ